jgi:hypothetical protein
VGALNGSIRIVWLEGSGQANCGDHFVRRVEDRGANSARERGIGADGVALRLDGRQFALQFGDFQIRD